MPKKNYTGDDGGSLLGGLILLIFIGIYLLKPSREKLFVTTLILGITSIVSIFLWKHLKTKYDRNLIIRLKNSGQEDYLKNFINRFGLEDKKSTGFKFRNHNFNWDRINDLKKIFKEKKIIKKEKDIFFILKKYIQEKEEGVTRESIQITPQKFEDLSGPDFEKLLYRLFNSMGYKVELIGKTGDQGGDLIINKDGTRILVQAKCYQDWSTGNNSVQQVVGAMKFYYCSRAMVVTTSRFTPEAIFLARANQTELISKKQLQEMLLEYLKENWL